MLTGARKTPGMGAFESALERDFFTLLEFDRRVLAWYPQPVTFPVPAASDRRASKYTPDVAVEYSEAPGGSDVHRVELCEVKYREELARDWRMLKPRFKAGRAYARERGWTFRIYTDREIRTPRLENARFFLSYVGRGTDEMDIARLEFTLETLGVATPNRLFEMARVTSDEKGRMLAVLWHAIAIGRIAMDFDQPLTMHTLLWPPGS